MYCFKLGFAVGTVVFILLVLFNWLLVIQDKRRKVKKYNKRDKEQIRQPEEV